VTVSTRKCTQVAAVEIDGGKWEIKFTYQGPGKQILYTCDNKELMIDQLKIELAKV